MNLKPFACFLCLVILMNSCSKGKKVPNNLIDQEKMGTIIFDIALAEAYLENYRFRDTTVNRDSLLTLELDKVLTIHNVSQQEFLDTYKYYESNPEIFKVMTDTIYNRSQRNPEKIYGRKSRPDIKDNKNK